MDIEGSSGTSKAEALSTNLSLAGLDIPRILELIAQLKMFIEKCRVTPLEISFRKSPSSFNREEADLC